jgi:hypothetical protein
MSQVDATATELFESMTGYDEIAIGKAFGATPTELQGTLLGRAMVFIALRRAGSNDVDALDGAMKVTVKELADYFVPEGDEESGKESESTALSPASLPPSA